MKLPELMILPIFNEPADIPTDSGLDVEAFEEEEKKKLPTEQPQVLNIDELSIQAGKMEAESDNKKYTPTKEELDKLEDELRKLNEQKFGSLQTESAVSQNSREMMLTTNSDIIESIPSDDKISDWDVTLMDGLEDESDFFEDESPLYESEKKTLSYLRSHG
jgi:methionine synthase II (cobalamin-independent)